MALCADHCYFRLVVDGLRFLSLPKHFSFAGVFSFAVLVEIDQGDARDLTAKTFFILDRLEPYVNHMISEVKAGRISNAQFRQGYEAKRAELVRSWNKRRRRETQPLPSSLRPFAPPPGRDA